MEVILSSLVAVPRNEIAPSLLEELQSLAIRENPEWREKKKRGYLVEDADQYILSYKTSADGQYVYFTRGLWDNIRDILDARSISYTVSDRRTVTPPLNCLLKWDIELFKYQERALNELVQYDDGILVANCGAGKTVIGSAIITKINQRTIIVVTTKEIMDQWVDSIGKFTDYSKSKIGRIGGGQWNVKPITVATFQSLGKVDPEEQKQLNDYFGCMLLDECHHNSANLLYHIANKTRVKHKYGLTATPKRKDKKEFMVFNAISHKMVNIPDEELQAEGRSIIPSVRTVEFPGRRILPTSMRWNGRRRVEEVNWSKLYSDLASDGNRNKIIVENVLTTVKEGHRCLVLCNRVEHCNLLKKLLDEAGVTTGLMIGKNDNDDRSDVKRRAKAGELDVLIATYQLATEGLDVPILSCVHILMPTTNQNFLQQATGRVRRPFDGKSALVVDYHDLDDEDSKTLFSMFMSRLHFYKTLGYPILSDNNQNENKIRFV